MKSFFMTTTDTVESIIDSILEVRKVNHVDELTFSEQCLILSAIVNDKENYNWVENIYDNEEKINELLSTALRSQRKEDSINFVEELKECLVNYYKPHIDDLLRERIDMYTHGVNTSWETEMEEQLLNGV